jgi:hypothetical protein
MAFPDQIAQGGIFVIPSLQSPNYVAGTSGWIINGDGTTEFNNGVYRGSVDIGGPNPQKSDAHLGDLTNYGFPSFYGLGAATNRNIDFSEVTIGAGSYAVVGLGAPTPNPSYYSELKGVIHHGTNPALYLSSPAEINGAAYNNSVIRLVGTSITDSNYNIELDGSAVNIQSNNMDINGRGVIRDGNSLTGRQLSIKYTESFVATNALGIANIDPLFTTLVGFLPWNGDGAARPNMVIGNNRTAWPVSGNTVDLRITTGNTGAVMASTNVRIGWFAIGIL